MLPEVDKDMYNDYADAPPAKWVTSMVKFESTAGIIVSGINLTGGLASTAGIIATGVSFMVGLALT
jgi:hypothetical protein